MAETGARQPLEPKTIERRMGEVVQDDPQVIAAYLFGSRARGEAHPASDVDLAILFDEGQNLHELVNLECDIEDAPGAKGDLFDLRKASASLALDAIRGERVYCADSTRCDELTQEALFQILTKRLGDFEPLLGAIDPWLAGHADKARSEL